MHNKGKHLCAGCNHFFAEPDIEWGPDPFSSEIHDDHTPMWLCDDCRYNSMMEI
jgi:hypothetical protein